MRRIDATVDAENVGKSVDAKMGDDDDDDDRIILLTNRGDAVDDLAPNLRTSGCEDLELQSPGYQVLTPAI